MSTGGRIALFVLGASIVTSLAGCRETVAPPARTVVASHVFGSGVTTPLAKADTTHFHLVIDPWRRATYSLGAGNSVTFPAGAICDPARAEYGVAEWDTPCAATRTAVTVDVKAWLDADGHARMEFAPNLRFVPSVLPAGWVTLTFADARASRNPRFNILDCAENGAHCSDESARDATLRTGHNALDGIVTRRIKHFSGYRLGESRKG